jgi:translation elongation factor EF-1alpha
MKYFSKINYILRYLTGQAREKSRESWYLSWALDTNEEERDKGKTVEVGRAWFETEKNILLFLMHLVINVLFQI